MKENLSLCGRLELYYLLSGALLHFAYTAGPVSAKYRNVVKINKYIQFADTFDLYLNSVKQRSPWFWLNPPTLPARLAFQISETFGLEVKFKYRTSKRIHIFLG